MCPLKILPSLVGLDEGRTPTFRRQPFLVEIGSTEIPVGPFTRRANENSWTGIKLEIRAKGRKEQENLPLKAARMYFSTSAFSAVLGNGCRVKTRFLNVFPL
jgi:hypothetical protein